MSKSDSIILSIKPMYWERIVKRTKQYEYRRRLASKSVDRIYFYVTAPIKKVMGYAELWGSYADLPGYMWERTKYVSGISEEDFFAYFNGCKRAYAYGLDAVTVFENPKELSEFGLKRAPQSFVYVNEEGI